MHSISDFFNSLDATTYFLVNSGIVIAITASIFFTFGLLFGAFTWARYKIRWLRSDATIKSLKADNAQLKRRLADTATRALHISASQSAKIQYVPVILPPAVTTTPVTAPVIRPAFTFRSAAFTVWTEKALGTPADAAFPAWTENSPQEQKPPEASSPEIPPDSWIGSKLNVSTVNESADLTHPFRSELENGQVHHDPLLGIIFDKPPKKGDDLTKIKGINVNCRNSLQALGIYTYKQIAHWTPLQVGEFAQRLSLDARMQVDLWVDQARLLYTKKHVTRI